MSHNLNTKRQHSSQDSLFSKSMIFFKDMFQSFHARVMGLHGTARKQATQWAGLIKRIHPWRGANLFEAAVKLNNARYLSLHLMDEQSMKHEYYVNQFKNTFISYYIFFIVHYVIFGISYIQAALLTLLTDVGQVAKFNISPNAMDESMRLAVRDWYDKMHENLKSEPRYRRFMCIVMSYQQYRLVIAGMMLWNTCIDLIFFAPKFILNLFEFCTTRLCAVINNIAVAGMEFEQLCARIFLNEWKAMDIWNHVAPLALMIAIYVNFSVLLSFSALPLVLMLASRAVWSQLSAMTGHIEERGSSDWLSMLEDRMSQYVVIGCVAMMAWLILNPVSNNPLFLSLCTLGLLSNGYAGLYQYEKSALWSVASLLCFALTVQLLPFWMSACLFVCSSFAYNTLYHLYENLRVQFHILCLEVSTIVVLTLDDVVYKTLKECVQSLIGKPSVQAERVSYDADKSQMQQLSQDGGVYHRVFPSEKGDILDAADAATVRNDGSGSSKV